MSSTHPLWQLDADRGSGSSCASRRRSSGCSRFRSCSRVRWASRSDRRGAPTCSSGCSRAPTAAALQETLTRAKGVRGPDASTGRRPTKRLRNGAIHLLVVPGDPVTYEFDPSRPESRVGRYVVDDLLQTAAGPQGGGAGQRPAGHQCRARATSTCWSPGLLGMNIMGTGMWSVAFSVVKARVPEAAQAPDRHADATQPLPAVAHALAAGVPGAGGGSRCSGLRGWSSASPSTARGSLLAGFCLLGRGDVLRPRAAGGQPGADGRGRVRV